MLSTNPHKRRCHAYLPETQHRVKYVNREGTAFLFIQVNYYVFSFWESHAPWVITKRLFSNLFIVFPPRSTFLLKYIV